MCDSRKQKVSNHAKILALDHRLLQIHRVEMFPAGARPPCVWIASEEQWGMGINETVSSWKIGWFPSLWDHGQYYGEQMENFAIKGVSGEAKKGKAMMERQRCWGGVREGFIQLDCREVLFSAEATVGLCWLVGAVHSAFSSFVWLNRALRRGTLSSAACLLPFLCLIYCNVGLCGGEPASNWLTHLASLENETYPSVCLRNSAWCQGPWFVLLITVSTSPARGFLCLELVSFHCDASHLGLSLCSSWNKARPRMQ